MSVAKWRGVTNPKTSFADCFQYLVDQELDRSPSLVWSLNRAYVAWPVVIDNMYVLTYASER